MFLLFLMYQKIMRYYYSMFAKSKKKRKNLLALVLIEIIFYKLKGYQNLVIS